ncbi:MAG TPA: serine kinase [Rhodanobacteraceae bacterium]|nr:serine kinase [Rhodanobacteraceae bacterium]
MLRTFEIAATFAASKRTHAEAGAGVPLRSIDISSALAPCQPSRDKDENARRRASPPSISRCLLGARFRFVSDSRRLLRLVMSAYDGLPQHRWPAAPEFLIELHLLPRGQRAFEEPPPLQTQEMPDALCGVIDAANYVLVMPARERALIVASEDMLAEHAQHLRQELIEFAVFILAARSQGLVPLHAACFGMNGRGLLLLGDSGAGKSTLALQAFVHGWELLSEDAVFVRPNGMFATGIGNFLRVRTDAVLFDRDEKVAHWIRRSPVIRRNSGVRKFEVDLRRGPGRLASAPLHLQAVVFLANDLATIPERPLQPVAAIEAAGMLCADQAYAATQPGWDRFVAGVRQLPAYRLQRTDPVIALTALRSCLD